MKFQIKPGFDDRGMMRYNLCDLSIEDVGSIKFALRAVLRGNLTVDTRTELTNLLDDMKTALNNAEVL